MPRDPKIDHEKAYAAERNRVAGEKIWVSAQRKLGRMVRGDADTWPAKAQSEYDPRRR